MVLEQHEPASCEDHGSGERRKNPHPRASHPASLSAASLASLPSRMRVGLDLLFLLPGQTGGRETYARELIRGLAAERPDLELTSFVNRETAAAGRGFWSDHGETVE